MIEPDVVQRKIGSISNS